MSRRPFSLIIINFIINFIIITMILTIVAIPPPMAKAQSFTIKTRASNMTSTLKHNLRQKLLNQTSKTRSSHLNPGIIPVSLPSGMFYVSSHIGTPSFTVYLALDTMTPLTWVQSDDCHDCFDVPFGNFDPKMSTTFQRLSSNNTNICSPPLAHPSHDGLACVYESEYSRGLFGVDEFRLAMPSRSRRSSTPTTTVPIAFGVGTRNLVDFNVGLDMNPIGGIIGLATGHPSSIVSQLGSDRFSYCLPRFDTLSLDPTLTFGSDAFISTTAKGVQTAHIFYHEYYTYLNMTSLTLNGETIYVVPEISSWDKHVLLDTGAPSTILVSDAYYSLQDSIVRYFAEKYGWKEPKTSSIGSSQSSNPTYALCYDIPANLSAEVVFPKVAMQFLGGATLDLDDVFEIFPDSNEMCMVVMEGDMEGAPNVVGVFQQIGYRFLFDLAQSKLTFAPNMC